ncbi:MAG: hypothetical protein LAO20_21730 [Acidobacteriia bacterium]|nr:hypothetical protein [Terriglobia bacterium]
MAMETLQETAAPMGVKTSRIVEITDEDETIMIVFVAVAYMASSAMVPATASSTMMITTTSIMLANKNNTVGVR